MLYTLILKECDTGVYNLIYDVKNNGEMYHNYIDS